MRLIGLAVILSLTLAPLHVEAQRAGEVYRIGFLANIRPNTPQTIRNVDAFKQGLCERGWVEGQNMIIEWRYSDGRAERFPDLAAELVRLKGNIIVAVATPAGRAAKQATTTIPIVVSAVSDPVGQGLVASLSRPGGNVTGLATLFIPFWGNDEPVKLAQALKAALDQTNRRK